MKYKIVEYIWVDGKGKLRSKTRVLYDTLDVLPWDFDGSSTHQASKEDSEVCLTPVYICPCPFRPGHELALCETFVNGKPTDSNKRAQARPIFEKYREQRPVYGLEQEYYLTLGKSDQEHYCTIGDAHPLARKIVETHLAYCLRAGIPISGINAEVGSNQWEFQIGPQEGIFAADQLWLARFILIKICESFGVGVTFSPKPYPEQSGSGCHVNFSTRDMRSDGGYDHIVQAIEKLEARHDHHMKDYGSGNESRMTGEHETACFDTFTWGVGDRTASVRVNQTTFTNKKGYLEDRRPAANMDPYVVTSMILETISSDIALD